MAYLLARSVSRFSPRVDDIHQENLATFRKAINELREHPSAYLADRTDLVLRVQEWRKAVGHITHWAGMPGLTTNERQEIFYLLEVSAVRHPCPSYY